MENEIEMTPEEEMDYLYHETAERIRELMVLTDSRTVCRTAWQLMQRLKKDVATVRAAMEEGIA